MNSNNKQQKLIENTEGIYLVDAGAGTGKTFTITQRYARILERGAEPDDIFLATFTRNAADEMKERIAEQCEDRSTEIFQAPICTFHSHCKNIIEREGLEVPQLLGIDDYIPNSIQIIESQIREKQEFSTFMDGFMEDYPEYSEFYRMARDQENLLWLLHSLAAKGIVPEKEGWFGETGEYLDGDYERFKQLFKEKNKPQDSSNGKKQSELRDRLYSYRWKDFPEDAPDAGDIRGDRGTKSIRRDFMKKSFKENREELKSFVHDLYFEYLQFCITREYLNFSFLMALTFVLLHQREDVREKEKFDYIMIDEFQDTNEIQFKLSLLLARKPNIVAVGDWKQSIYSFQYASVENIQLFKDRTNHYIEELNAGGKRVSFENPEIEKIELKKNYRSAQKILDFADRTLELPARKKEKVEQRKTVGLESQTQNQEFTLEKFCSEDEPGSVLTKAVKIQDNEEFRDRDGEKLSYGDIAILTRTRNLALDIQEEANRRGIPAAYEGGVELFRQPPGVTVLAWLRILESNNQRGWAVALERAGYSIEEAEAMLEQNNYPDNMERFRAMLQDIDSIAGVTRKILNRYGYTGPYAEKIVEVLSDTFSSSSMNLGGVIQFIEDNIDDGEIYEVDTSIGENNIKIQTIHGAKGLEYPAVFLAGVNKRVFPNTNSDTPSIVFDEEIGLRKTKVLQNGDYPHVFDNWKYEILSKVLAGDQDEERRLFYVTATRAENHLFISSREGRSSTFYEELEISEEKVEPKEIEVEKRPDEREVLDVEELET